MVPVLFLCGFLTSYSHVGLAGNSEADSAAKAALLLTVSSLTVQHCDDKSLVCIQALKALATTLEFWDWEQAAFSRTKGECSHHVTLTSLRWGYYSQVKNWTHILCMDQGRRSVQNIGGKPWPDLSQGGQNRGAEGSSAKGARIEAP